MSQSIPPPKSGDHLTTRGAIKTSRSGRILSRIYSQNHVVIRNANAGALGEKGNGEGVASSRPDLGFLSLLGPSLTSHRQYALVPQRVTKRKMSKRSSRSEICQSVGTQYLVRQSLRTLCA